MQIDASTWIHLSCKYFDLSLVFLEGFKHGGVLWCSTDLRARSGSGTRDDGGTGRPTGQAVGRRRLGGVQWGGMAVGTSEELGDSGLSGEELSDEELGFFGGK